MPIGAHHRPAAKRIRTFARDMRHAATDAEAAMWHLLRDRRFSQVKFRRQVPFQNYILDFVCFERRLIIEIDGSRIWIPIGMKDAMPFWPARYFKSSGAGTMTS